MGQWLEHSTENQPDIYVSLRGAWGDKTPHGRLDKTWCAFWKICGPRGSARAALFDFLLLRYTGEGARQQY